MEDATLQAQLQELMGQITVLPAAQRPSIHAPQTDEEHRAAGASLQETLDYLRMATKYMAFDLEATRRENRGLRKLIERYAFESHEGHAGDPG